MEIHQKNSEYIYVAGGGVFLVCTRKKLKLVTSDIDEFTFFFDMLYTAS